VRRFRAARTMKAKAQKGVKTGRRRQRKTAAETPSRSKRAREPRLYPIIREADDEKKKGLVGSVVKANMTPNFGGGMSEKNHY